MNTAVYPGSFDPVTFGHIDIIKRACKVTDKLIIGVLKNSEKTPLFSVEERVNMLKEVTKDMPEVEIRSFEGLLIEFVKQCGASMVIRGLRAVTDFEYELQLAQINKAIYPEIDTLFLVTSVKHSYLSSSVVREIASYNGRIDTFVPEFISIMLKEKFSNKESKDEQN